MMNDKEFKEQHLPGFKGIRYLYGLNRIERAWPLFFGLIIATIAIILFEASETPVSKVLEVLIPLANTIYPTVLGFSLAGFALVIGFSSSSNFEWFTDRAKNETGSLYQITVAIFSIHLIVNLITVFSFFTISLALQTKAYLNLEWLVNLLYDNPGIKHLVLLILIFLSVYSLATLPILVINIFNLSQANHSVAATNRYIESLPEKSNEKDSN